MRPSHLNNNSLTGRAVESNQSFSQPTGRGLPSRDTSALLPAFTHRDCNYNTRYFQPTAPIHPLSPPPQPQGLWERDEVLPEVRSSYKHTKHLKKIVPENPETRLAGVKTRAEPKRRQSCFKPTPIKLIGHLYSPRSKAVSGTPAAKTDSSVKLWDGRVNQGKSRVQFTAALLADTPSKNKEEGRKSGARKERKASKERKVSSRSPAHPAQQSEVKVRKIKKVPRKQVPTGEHCTQSRMTLIGEEVNDLLKKAPSTANLWQSQMGLRNEGRAGFTHCADLDPDTGREEQLRILCQGEEGGLDERIPRAIFYLEGNVDQTVVEVGLTTKLSEIKILLLESQTLRTSFRFPTSLTNAISPATPQSEIHRSVQKAFSDVGRNTEGQMASFKRFTNCVLVTVSLSQSEPLPHLPDKLALLWYYSGEFYLGKWRSGTGEVEGYRCGLGLEYFPKGFIYYGTFEGNVREGYGVMKTAREEIYLGEWSANSKDGWGKVFDSTGQLTLNGYFREGRFYRDRHQSK